jgi:hypothetical protein
VGSRRNGKQINKVATGSLIKQKERKRKIYALLPLHVHMIECYRKHKHSAAGIETKCERILFQYLFRFDGEGIFDMSEYLCEEKKEREGEFQATCKRLASVVVCE